jgi:hypothetical protein
MIPREVKRKLEMQSAKTNRDLKSQCSFLLAQGSVNHGSDTKELNLEIKNSTLGEAEGRGLQLGKKP